MNKSVAGSDSRILIVIFISPKAKAESQYKHNQTRRRVPERHRPIVLDTISNAENYTSNII